jgi:hypothetical protein
MMVHYSFIWWNDINWQKAQLSEMDRNMFQCHYRLHMYYCGCVMFITNLLHNSCICYQLLLQHISAIILGHLQGASKFH